MHVVPPPSDSLSILHAQIQMPDRIRPYTPQSTLLSVFCAEQRVAAYKGYRTVPLTQAVHLWRETDDNG